MPKEEYPVTQAIRLLRQFKIPFVPHQYEYEEKGGTHQTSEVLKVPEHKVIKTLIFQDETGKGLIVLMHGDMEVSTKELARKLCVKRTEPCDAARALKLTGYQFGGTSPFGTKTSMNVYVEYSIFDLDKIYINGGKRGFILEIKPDDLKNVLTTFEVKVAINK
jgi:Cys-tRNA(Pro) deacylase